MTGYTGTLTTPPDDTFYPDGGRHEATLYDVEPDAEVPPSPPAGPEVVEAEQGTGTGGIGFRLDDETRVLLRLDEPEDWLQPTDEAEGLEDMAPVESGSHVGTGLIGRCREGALLHGLVAEERTPGGLNLSRSMTFEAIAYWNRDTGHRHVIAHGGTQSLDGDDHTLWEVGLEASTETITLRHNSALAAITCTIACALPADSWFYLAIVRRWISTASLTYEAYVNGVLIGSTTSTSADISGATGQFISLGCGWDAGVSLVYDKWLEGGIDQVRISDAARSAEEIRQTWRQIQTYPARGYDLVRAFVATMGREVFTQDPSSYIQRMLMVEGDGLGYALGLAAELKEDFLPHRAYGVALERWEALTGITPRPADSIATRRLRVCSHLWTEAGYSCGQVLAMVAELLDTTAANLSILEFCAVFSWYVYRNPALGGSPDMAGARAVIERMKPAHTYGGLCESTSLLCDTQYNYCDETPIGG